MNKSSVQCSVLFSKTSEHNMSEPKFPVTPSQLLMKFHEKAY